MWWRLAIYGDRRVWADDRADGAASAGASRINQRGGVIALGVEGACYVNDVLRADRNTEFASLAALRVDDDTPLYHINLIVMSARISDDQRRPSTCQCSIAPLLQNQR